MLTKKNNNLIGRLDVLIVIIACISFVATLSIISVGWLGEFSKSTSLDVKSKATIEILSQDDVSTVLRTLSENPKVISYDLLSQDDVLSLLGDSDMELSNIQLPNLIAIEVDEDANLEQIRQILPSGVNLDTHETWLADLVELLFVANVFISFSIAIICFAGAVCVCGAVGAKLSIQKKEIDLLYTLGASDFYISRQFIKQAVEMCAIGSFIGGVLCALAFLLASHFVGFSISIFSLCAIIFLVCSSAVLIGSISAAYVLYKNLRGGNAY